MFLRIAIEHPYLELRKYADAYVGPQHDERSVRYHLYVEAMFNTMQQLFEGSHCDKYLTEPCESVCMECIKRIVDVANLSRVLRTHRAWWNHHHSHYDDHYPNFAHFINQIYELIDRD